MNKRALWLCTALAAASLASLASVAGASTRGTPSTISNVVWGAAWAPATSPFATCTQLRVDTTGDMTNSSTLSVYGSFSCTANANTAARTMGASGSGYFSPDGQFNMTLIFGNGTALQCLKWGSLSGTCQITDSAGAVTGTVQLTLI